jgi:hypothetical protein
MESVNKIYTIVNLETVQTANGPGAIKRLLRLSYKRFVKEGKAIPLQAWTGPQGSRRLRLPDFKTIGT